MIKDKDRRRLYSIWYTMKRRCKDKNINDYYRYGGRGIAYCKEWEDFNSFYEWAISHGYKSDLTLDRIDNDGNYEPQNCRWADLYEQANKRSSSKYLTLNGETLSIQQWSRKTGIKPTTISYRISRNKPIEEVLFCGDRRVMK